jgi:hypothetical protein
MGDQMTKVREDLVSLVAERLTKLSPEGHVTDEILVHAEMIVDLKTTIMTTALFARGRASAHTFDRARRLPQAAALRALAS